MSKLVVTTNTPEKLPIEDNIGFWDNILYVFDLVGQVDRIKNYLETSEVSSIVILNVAENISPIDYARDLTTLIDYLIFDNQGTVVNGNLAIISFDDTIHDTSMNICQEKQRKITKLNYALFPVPEETCFLSSIEGLQINTSKFHSEYLTKLSMYFVDETDKKLKYFGEEAVLRVRFLKGKFVQGGCAISANSGNAEIHLQYYIDNPMEMAGAPVPNISLYSSNETDVTKNERT